MHAAAGTATIGTTPRKKRRPYRRDEILTAAVRLFREQGYHATGMDQIGAAAGISGPAIYRHFRGKEEILETLLLENSERALVEAHRIVGEAAGPEEALGGLVRLYVEALADNPDLAFVARFERRTLPPRTRAVAERYERLHLEEWAHALQQLRPELTDAEARTMIRAANGLGTAGVAYRSGLDRDTLVDLLADMIMKALLPSRPARARAPR